MHEARSSAVNQTQLVSSKVQNTFSSQTRAEQLWRENDAVGPVGTPAPGMSVGSKHNPFQIALQLKAKHNNEAVPNPAMQSVLGGAWFRHGPTGDKQQRAWCCFATSCPGSHHQRSHPRAALSESHAATRISGHPFCSNTLCHDGKGMKKPLMSLISFSHHKTR